MTIHMSGCLTMTRCRCCFSLRWLQVLVFVWLWKGNDWFICILWKKKWIFPGQRWMFICETNTQNNRARTIDTKQVCKKNEKNCLVRIRNTMADVTFVRPLHMRQSTVIPNTTVPFVVRSMSASKRHRSKQITADAIRRCRGHMERFKCADDKPESESGTNATKSKSKRKHRRAWMRWCESMMNTYLGIFGLRFLWFQCCCFCSCCCFSESFAKKMDDTLHKQAHTKCWH